MNFFFISFTSVNYSVRNSGTMGGEVTVGHISGGTWRGGFEYSTVIEDGWFITTKRYESGDIFLYVIVSDSGRGRTLVNFYSRAKNAAVVLYRAKKKKNKIKLTSTKPAHIYYSKTVTVITTPIYTYKRVCYIQLNQARN